jgi:LexA-binding, inner membrane-associated putative hydrolase
MFIGHFALAFGAKRAAPSVSLAVLFIACELADLIWPVLVVAGIERVEVQPGITAFTPLNFISYPYSHSLVMLCVWALALAGVYVAMARAGLPAAATIALLVLSHWVLDVVTHRPDMPLAPWSGTRIGLGLWNSVAGTIAVEAAMFGAGVLLFLRAAPPATRGRTIALWALVAVLTTLYLGNAFGPPPPSAAAVAWSANGIWLFVLWAYFIDRSRSRHGHA